MRAVTILSLALLAGCESGVGSGPLAFGIVSGNNQTATAGSNRLTDPVVGKLVRTPDGGITFNLVRSAYAQTVVSGSPVPGAVVCAVSISENGMVPWVPCTNTDSAGQATFFFTPGTRADTVRSEIRGTVSGEPAVFDTASAVVQPGPPVYGSVMARCTGGGSYTDTLNVARDFGSPHVADLYNNPIDWKLRPFLTSTLFTVTPDSQTIVAAPEGSGIDSVQVVAAGEVARVSHVYVRHPEVESRVMLFAWIKQNGEYNCGDVSIPVP
jgi:hypothetical protein